MAIPNEEDGKIESKASGKEKLVEYLHNKAPLSSLRTYHGDMAEFIKEKNESVISIATKEKERRDEKKDKEEKMGNLIPRPHPQSTKNGLQINFTILLSSLVLIVGGGITLFYIFKAITTPSQQKVEIKEEIIPYNNAVTIANVTSGTFGSELSKIIPGSGISIVKISDTNGKVLEKSKDFFNFMKIAPPATLWRTLGDRYAVGAISQDGEVSTFIVISTNDFGLAFSSMLEWEKNMEENLSFLNLSPTQNTKATSTPLSHSTFVWKDLVIKNKDTRVLVNSQNQIKMAYSFLDKETILITNNVSAIGSIATSFASRSFTR